jgi:8-oxo-dGTP diphosphatase
MLQYTDMRQVVAAVIEREGRILICRRKADQPHPLKWEFPGGKVEPDEAPEQALTRELEEELGIRAAVGREITRYRFAYPAKSPIEPIFYRIRSYMGEPENRIFQEMRWEPPAGLTRFDFLEGDIEFIRGISDFLAESGRRPDKPGT